MVSFRKKRTMNKQFGLFEKIKSNRFLMNGKKQSEQYKIVGTILKNNHFVTKPTNFPKDYKNERFFRRIFF